MYISKRSILVKTNFWVTIRLNMVLTHGDGAEHFGQRIRQFFIAFVHFEVHFTKVWCAVHGNLDECSRISGTCLLRSLRFTVDLLCHNVLPEWSHWWPTHHLCPLTIIIFQLFYPSIIFNLYSNFCQYDNKEDWT